jgi:prepilin signal peptidase PulO-like enzyme (type II secretory pathway)
MFAFPAYDAVKSVLVHVAPGMPPDYWWVTAFVLVILGMAATIDAFTTVVPDGLIFLGMLALALAQGTNVSWTVAGIHLFQGIIAAVLIWLINLLWYLRFEHDALGMGDAKWTALAVACFGIAPGLWAWGLGSILAVIAIGVAFLLRYQVTQVTFAPFLFIGLAVGLWWVRFLG